MIDLRNVKEGDKLCWQGKGGDIIAEVRRTSWGDLAAFTDETHCLALSTLAGSGSVRIVGAAQSEETEAPVQVAAPTYTMDNAPVLF